MRNNCPKCGIGHLVPVKGSTGRECTKCGFQTVAAPLVLGNQTHKHIVESRPYVQPTCQVNNCTRGADIVENWPNVSFKVCAKHYVEREV